MPDSPAARPEPAGPAVIQAGGVFLPAAVCHPLWLALRRELARHRGDGGMVRPEVAAALDALRAAALHHLTAVSADGPPARTSADPGPSSDREQLVTTEQLADRLDVSQRHVRRLAARHGVTPVGRNAWRPDDADHLAHLRRT